MSLMDLSNRILSGCWVSLLMGFSYLECLNPHELAARAARTTIPVHELRSVIAKNLTHRPKPAPVLLTLHNCSLDSQCEIPTTQRPPIRRPHPPLPQRYRA